MKNKTKKYFMPKIVRKITGITHKAWIVGGAANPNAKTVKDFDIAVSYSEWPRIASLIPSYAKPTLYGGWKVRCDGWDVDIWPAEVIDIFSCAKCQWMWQPQLNIRIKRTEAEPIKKINAY